MSLCPTCAGRTVVAGVRGWEDCPTCGAAGRIPEAAEMAAVGVQKAVVPLAKGCLPVSAMNGTERSYAAYLDLLKGSGEVAWWAFEAVTVKLGHDCRLTPDFLVMFADGSLQFHDTKGATKIKVGRRAGEKTYHAEEDAIVKARVLAAHFVIPIFFVWPELAGAWGKKEL